MLKGIAKLLVMLVISTALVVIAYLGGFATSRTLLAQPQAPVTAVQDGAPAEFTSVMPVFWEAWGLVKNNFYQQPLDDTKLTYGSVSGFVDAFGDPHTSFSSPDQAKYLNDELEGAFEGIGATVEMQQGRVIIVSPIKGTPADKAGLQAGDTILQVDETVIQNMNLQQAIALIRGPKGTPVRLKVQRGTAPAFEISVVRDRIEVPPIEARNVGTNKDIVYIGLNEFTANAPQALRNALDSAREQNARAIIFDLRNNPGGLLNVAVKIANEFMVNGQIVVVEKYKNGQRDLFRADGYGTMPDIPLVLLVNNGSASASEIVAAAFKDYKRATIVGTKTFGKGSVQSPMNLSDQSQLRVTVAHFFSPNENEIDGVGVTPDIEVPNPTAADLNRGIDQQLDRAIEFIESGGKLVPSQAGQTNWNVPLLPSLEGASASIEALGKRIWIELQLHKFHI